MVNLLIQQGAHVDERCANGSTSLHLAARQGHVAAAGALLDAHASVNHADSSGCTPLHIAVQSKKLLMMQLLLDAGADLEATDHEGRTPLLLAAQCYQHQPTTLLLAAGADVAAKCAAGDTALHYACRHSSLAVVRALLGAGAPVDAVNEQGLTPLYAVCGRGSDADARVVDAPITSGAQLSTPDEDGYLPLHVAADEGCTKVAACLLRAHPALEHVNAEGLDSFTPLHLAVSSGHSKMVALLLGAGADVAARDVAGCTPLHEAVEQQHLPIVKQLLAAGADPGAADDGERSAVSMAAARGYTAILQALVAAEQGDAAVDADAGGVTPLALAAENGHAKCVEVLLAAGADPNKLYGAAAVTVESGSSMGGATVLHRAVQLGHTAVVPLLATPANMRHFWLGYTPLHVALMGGRPPSMAQALVAAGSPAGIDNQGGVTAMRMAAESSDAAIRALLPAMVRRECKRYQQLQVGREAQQQLGRRVAAWCRQRCGEEQQQQDPAAVLAAVVVAMYTLLRVSAATSTKSPDVCMACIQSVLGVLEGAAASPVMDLLLSLCIVADTQAATLGADAAAAAEGHGSCCLPLVKALGKGCSAALQPLMQQRRLLTNRLQQLVAAPLQQPPPPAAPQQQQGPEQRAGAAAGEAPHQAVTDKQLAAQATAAAHAREWKRFVQLWEQLLGRQRAAANRVLTSVAQQQAKSPLEGAGYLCWALLEAWEAAQQRVAVRKQRELAEVVVGAVQAAQQQDVAAGRRRRGRR
jgi:ankyrin repeat protein